jgi:hypothetical protein
VEPQTAKVKRIALELERLLARMFLLEPADLQTMLVLLRRLQKL